MIDRKPNGYWTCWDNVEKELRLLMQENHGLIPGRSDFIEKRLGGLLMAVQIHHGGLTLVRERLGVADRKYCADCDKVLAKTDFRCRTQKTKKVHRENICKKCNSKRVEKYRKSENGRCAEFCRSAKHRAKREGWEFDLSKEWIEERLKIIDWKCELTGIPFEHHGSQHAFASPYVVSIDRIDSLRGYTKDNVQFVLNWANWSKKSLPVNEFIDLCKAVAKHKE